MSDPIPFRRPMPSAGIHDELHAADPAWTTYWPQRWAQGGHRGGRRGGPRARPHRPADARAARAASRSASTATPGSSRCATRRAASARPRPRSTWAPRSRSTAARCCSSTSTRRASLSVGLGLNPHDMELSIYNLLMQRDVTIDEVIVPTSVPGMDLLPVQHRPLRCRGAAGARGRPRADPASGCCSRRSRDYDVILIDCQPSLGLLTVNALTASDGVIVPLECEYFALRGVALLKTTIDKVSERLNPKLRDRRRARHHVRRPHAARPRGHGAARPGVGRHRLPHRDPAHREVLRLHRRRRADHDLRVDSARGRVATASSPRRCWPGVSTSERAGGRRPVPADSRPGPHSHPVRCPRRESALDGSRTSARAPSGRVRHDEKMTVYVTADELLDIEHARLAAAACTASPSTAAGWSARPSRWPWPTST